jgi:hypothetical protein
VHFAILPVFSWNFGTSKGQPVAQYPHPMQASGLTSTIPFSYWTMAPGAGQAARHPGSSQCMHWSFRISQEKTPSCSCSLKRIRFQNSEWRAGIVW